ncbi:MAG: hypothetical protein GX312_00395 [Candidatus Phytoplasma sp.]|nr:hypothetical protein [Phytoplasma sp.]
MRNLFKRGCLLLLVASIGILVGAKNNIIYGMKYVYGDQPSFPTNKGVLGIFISEDYELFYGLENFHIKINRRDEPNDKHYTEVKEVVMRHKYESGIYLVAYHILTSPEQHRFGVNYYNGQIRAQISFPQEFGDDPTPDQYKILSHAPMNNPSSFTTSISVGLDFSGPSVSASVDYAHSELSIISKTKTQYSHYDVTHNVTGTSSYAKGEIISKGLMIFSSEEYPILATQYDVQYREEKGQSSNGAVSIYNYHR